MSVLVYTESENGKFKKNALEAASYAKGLADKMQTTVTAVVINAKDASVLGNYGVDKIISVNNDKLQDFHAKAYASVLENAALKENSTVVALSSSADSKYLAPVLSAKLRAGFVSNVTDLPTSVNPLVVKRSMFTNKAFGYTKITTPIAVLGIFSNTYGVVENKGTATVTPMELQLDNECFSVALSNVDKIDNQVTIADADIVVSGGRGLKGAENWGMIEELAGVLGAATACSKPVSDLGWRPHSEHVGQTGKPVACNLYIAIGISGAIQHLAGVSASKTKVVINTDSEAPFFKVADYGVIGDAFEVVPRLIQKLKEFKEQNA